MLTSRTDGSSADRDQREVDDQCDRQRGQADPDPDRGVAAVADRQVEAVHRRLPEERGEGAGHPQGGTDVDAEEDRPHPVRVEVERGQGDEERGQVVDEVGAERGEPEGERLTTGAGDAEDAVQAEGGRGAERQRAQREGERGGAHRHVLPRQRGG